MNIKRVTFMRSYKVGIPDARETFMPDTRNGISVFFVSGGDYIGVTRKEGDTTHAIMVPRERVDFLWVDPGELVQVQDDSPTPEPKPIVKKAS